MKLAKAAPPMGPPGRISGRAGRMKRVKVRAIDVQRRPIQGVFLTGTPLKSMENLG